MLTKQAYVKTLKDLTVIGLDPGLANLGLGAVKQKHRDFLYLGSEYITTNSRTPQGERLAHIYSVTRAFCEQHKPDVIAIEGQYFHRQREVAFKVGQAFGVCLLVAEQLEIPVFDYGPTQVKQALVGTGRASKDRVIYMVKALLNMRQQPDSNHVADALALALTHLNHHKIQTLSAR